MLFWHLKALRKTPRFLIRKDIRVPDAMTADEDADSYFVTTGGILDDSVQVAKKKGTKEAYNTV
jgi:hypothetical protein